MKMKQSILALVAALLVVTGMLGCQKDNAAVKALQELTSGQAEVVRQQNEELSNLVGQIETCQADLAKVKGEAAVIKSKDVSFDVPSLEGEASVESLDALKTAIADTLEKQKAQLGELKTAAEKCMSDLTAATEAAEKAAADAEAAAAAEAEAAAKAAEDAANKKKAAAAQKKKPAMVKEQEEKGVPTKGADSAFKKRQ